MDYPVPPEGWELRYRASRGGGGSGLSLWKNDFELVGVRGTARTRPDILKVVLGPYVFLDFGLNFFWRPKSKLGHD